MVITMKLEASMADTAEIFKSALSLSVHDRAALAEGLLHSLEFLGEEEAEVFWTEEAQRRLEGYRAGQAKTVSAEGLAARAESRFR
jgi:putative addiction module component (TIGR02574 family)